jgi:hypothetical protein
MSQRCSHQPQGNSHQVRPVSPSYRPLKTNACSDYAARHSLGNPIQLYPLYENAFRSHRNQSILDNHSESAQLYAEFADVAEKHPYSWSYGQKSETKESISTVGKRNRMICFPCTPFFPALSHAS